MTGIGVDIGGQTIRAARVDSDGRIIDSRKAVTPLDGDAEAIAGVVRSLVTTLQAETSDPPTAYPTAGVAGSEVVGIALPGRLAPDGRTMSRAVNLPGLEGLDVHAHFAAAIGGAISIRSDVSAAGYAQWRSVRVAGAMGPRQPARGASATGRPQRFIYLTFGTGVGGVAIIDGRIIDAAGGGPAQFGHLVVDTSADAALCRCGARGCLEAIAGGPAIDRTGLTDAAIRGLAIGLQQLSHLLAPEVIMLGGGVIEHHPDLVSRSAQALRAMQGSLTPAGLRVEAAPLSSDSAGVIGAALLAMAVDSAAHFDLDQ